MLSFLVTLATLASFVLDCTSVRTGSFEIRSGNGEVTFIERNDSLQTERTRDSGQILQFRIEWIDNCTYLLHHPVVLRGNKELFKSIENDTLINHITLIKQDRYFVSSTLASKGVEMESMVLRKNK